MPERGSGREVSFEDYAGDAHGPVPAVRTAPLIDGHGRRIDHLRLSVTPACDLQCAYCRPPGLASPRTPGAFSDGRRVQLIVMMVHCFGLRSVRITGGEPLLHKSIARLVARIHQELPAIEIAMTTNGRRLDRLAGELKRAGLARLNVSLDSHCPQTYRRITGADIGPVLCGLDAARDAGFAPPKVNTVVVRGQNDRELPELCAWALARGCEIRFLEAMPIGPAAHHNRNKFVSASEVLTRLRAEFEMLPTSASYGSTCRRFVARRPGLSGIIGLIAPVTRPFCGECRRLRLTADGRIYPCLLDDRNADLSTAWSDGIFHANKAVRLIQEIVRDKSGVGTVQSTAMVTLGG